MVFAKQVLTELFKDFSKTLDHQAFHSYVRNLMQTLLLKTTDSNAKLKQSVYEIAQAMSNHSMIGPNILIK